MLNRLKDHWKVKTTGLILILCTFAITGTITAWVSEKVAKWLLLDQFGFAWWVSNLIVFIFGYQVIILIVGYCFGMFSFFWKYEKRILRRFGLMKKEITSFRPLATGYRQQKPNLQPASRIQSANNGHELSILKNDEDQPACFLPHGKRLAIFASGAGSNAQKIIDYFRNSKIVDIALIVCNNPKAGVLNIAEKESIPLLLIEKNNFLQTGYVSELKENKIDLIILAGFLWKVPNVLIHSYPERVINIHPALLPAYGGKGMYGNAVHTSVINAGEKESGITIHFVDELYDHGKIIFQTTCAIDKTDTPEILAQKIHKLEHKFYSGQIEQVVKRMNK
jgi:formyltetrahydrofolate-dependent phosphoribosylglycinamide formyltransferase